MASRLAILLLGLLVACGGGEGKGKNQDDLLGILVDADTLRVPIGTELQLEAIGLYDGRSTADLTPVVDWKSSNKAIAKPSTQLDKEGVIVAQKLGTAGVWAKLGDVASERVQIVVTDQSITALSVEPSSLVLEKGQQVQLAATAQFSDGERSDATGLVRWVTSNGAVAQLNGGLLTAAGVGTTTIQAQLDDLISPPVTVQVLASASPDLTISTLTASPSPDGLNVTVSVHNSGTSGAADFWVDVFLDGPNNLGPGDVGDDFSRVNWVGPGETVQTVMLLEGVNSGVHTLTAVVDIEREVSELNENNNQAETDVNVSGTTGGALLQADISVDYVDWIADPFDVYYVVEITNYGDLGAGPFWVDVYVDENNAPTVGQDGDDWVEVPWIGAWQTIEVEFLVGANCYGCWSWVQADSYNTINEPVEWDNIYGPVDVSY